MLSRLHAHQALREKAAGLIEFAAASVPHAVQVCEHMFVREYGFQLAEHDGDRPWLVVSSEHRARGGRELPRVGASTLACSAMDDSARPVGGRARLALDQR